MQIALKECHETEYWLELLFRTEYIREEDYNVLNSECIQIKKMLMHSVRRNHSIHSRADFACIQRQTSIIINYLTIILFK
jgi:hypothetical protein